MDKKATEAAERLQKDWSGPMTQAEIAFLRDVQGLIEFAIRNKLSFSLVLSALAHDVNEIARAGFDYEMACSRGFHPKVSGYSTLTSDEFGENDEDEPPA